jgi:hypothetical protein
MDICFSRYGRMLCSELNGPKQHPGKTPPPPLPNPGDGFTHVLFGKLARDIDGQTTPATLFTSDLTSRTGGTMPALCSGPRLNFLRQTLILGTEQSND